MVTAQLAPAGVGIHNVLIATDFSQCSDRILEYGISLSKDYQAKAYVAFVVPSDEFLLAGPDAYVAAKDAARRDLIDLKAELLRAHSYVEGKDYHLYMLEGDAAQAILDFAQLKKTDLIVLGTHGRGGLSKALLGSVAEKVFRHSPVPVVTIGPCHRGSARRDAPKNILVAVDFTPASERAIREAALLAREHKATLTALHVLKRAAAGDGSLQGAKATLAELVKRASCGVDCALRVEVGPVVPTILHTAAQSETSLLVVGVRSSLGVLDRLMWPHAYELVREARCPVLTVRGKV
jgi:nucleotide-binding universal stress UspA family protein